MSCLQCTIHKISTIALSRSCLTDGDPYACEYMGFHAFSTYNGTRPKKENRLLYLLTSEQKPFCSDHYRVKIVLSDTREAYHQGGDR